MIETINGDCTEVIPTLSNIQTVITSPPYYGLRDYGIPGTAWPEIAYKPMAGLEEIIIPDMCSVLGSEETPEAYVAHMVHVFRLILDALRSDGTAWLNLGDSYTRGGRKTRDPGKSTMHPAYSEWAGTNTDTPRGLKPKDLMMIPARVAMALQADGWYLRSDIIWNKSNPMTESVTDRPTKAHEHIFLLSKSKKYYYDHEAIKEKSKYPKDNRHARVKHDHKSRLSEGRKGESKCAEGRTYPMRNKRTVWNIASSPYKGAHFAVFPPGLIETCVLAGSAPGDLVLDPFGGSGTTGMVAAKYNRRAILVEISEEYCKLHAERTTVQRSLLDF